MNDGYRNNLFLRLFGSIYLTIALLLLFAIAIAAATFVEVRFGTDGARAMVYNARWFEALLGLLILNLIAMLILGFPFRARSTGYVITHTSFIVILVSAGITRFFGYEGRMSIREGSSSDFIYSDRDYVQLVAGNGFASFPVRLFREGYCSIGKDLDVSGVKYAVTVAEYWPHYEEMMREGPGGEPAVEFALSGQSGMNRRTLTAGEPFRAGGLTVRLVGGALEETAEGERGASPQGDLVATVTGASYRLPVPEAPPAEMKAGDYVVRIVAFYPDFKVGAEPSPGDPMDNPAVRVRIEGPGGFSGERLVFALHPDFDMGHGGGVASSDVDLKYEYGRTLLVSVGDGGAVTARADFAAALSGMGRDAPEKTVPAGRPFPLEPGTMLQTEALALAPLDAWESATLQGGPSDDESLPPAARIVVENRAGERAEAVVEKWGGGETVELGGAPITVRYGPVRWKVPYQVQLDDFKLVTYPGSDNPASFESEVRIFDEERGVNGRPARIYMNHPLTYRGFKHFQSSYDGDRRGTILSVNHDPGRWPTYFGYAMLTVGLLITLTRGWLWHRHGDPGRNR